MKRIPYVFSLLVIMFIVSPLSAHAQNRSTGLGIMVGEPTGFNGKVWWDDVIAFDGGIAWSFADEAELSVHGDALWHNNEVLMDAFGITRDVTLPLYVGIGGRLKAGDETRIGVRFVVGASLIFEHAPFDLFFEIAPIMDILPKTELRAHTVIGTRFWF